MAAVAELFAECSNCLQDRGCNHIPHMSVLASVCPQTSHTAVLANVLSINSCALREACHCGPCHVAHSILLPHLPPEHERWLTSSK